MFIDIVRKDNSDNLGIDKEILVNCSLNIESLDYAHLTYLRGFLGMSLEQEVVVLHSSFGSIIAEKEAFDKINNRMLCSKLYDNGIMNKYVVNLDKVLYTEKLDNGNIFIIFTSGNILEVK